MTSGYRAHDVHQDHEGCTEGERARKWTSIQRGYCRCSTETYENQEKGSQSLGTDGLCVRVFKHSGHQMWSVEVTI